MESSHYPPIPPSTHPAMRPPDTHSPGVFDTMARALRPVIMLIRLDLPTFERPMTAGQYRGGTRGRGLLL
jgi:hypothetical protein